MQTLNTIAMMIAVTIGFVALVGIADRCYRARSPYAKQRVKKQIRSADGDELLLTIAKGSSVDDAVRTTFDRLNAKAAESVRADTVKRYADAMDRTIHTAKATYPTYNMSTYERMRDRAYGKYNAITLDAITHTMQKSASVYHAQSSGVRSISSSSAERERRLVTASLRYDILKRDQFRCCICGRSAQQDGVTLHVDHIVPVSKGGKSTPENLRTLCASCNIGKSDKLESPTCAHDSTRGATPDTASAARRVNAEPDRAASNTSINAEALFADYASIDELLRYLDRMRIPYINKTASGGCLWIQSAPSSDRTLSCVTVGGKPLQKAAKTKTFGGCPGWFVS